MMFSLWKFLKVFTIVLETNGQKDLLYFVKIDTEWWAEEKRHLT